MVNSLQTILALIFLAGIIGLIWTTIVYPKDVARGVFIETPKAIYQATLGRVLDLFIIPFWILFKLVDLVFKTEWAERVIHRVSFAEKSTEKQIINIHSFSRQIVIVGMSMEAIEYEIKEAAETSKELNISEYAIKRVGHVTVLELPNVGLYGFGFIVQWLANMSEGMVYGLAQSQDLQFAFYQPHESINLFGLTSEGKKFFIDLTEDVDKLGALRLDPDLIVREEMNQLISGKLQ